MRAALKHDARVRTELLKFWRVYCKDQEGHVSKAEYLNVHAKLCLVLIPDITPQEARSAGEEDWVADAHGEPHMSKEHLFDCVFELSDMWCTGISAEEYAAFLRKLFKRVTVKSITKANGAVVTAAPSTPSKGRLDEYRSFRERRASQMGKGQLIGTPAVLAGVVVPEGVAVEEGAEGEEGAPAPDAAAEAAEEAAAAVVSSEEEDEEEETRNIVSYAWAADSQLYPMVLFEKGDIDWAQFDDEASSPSPQSPPPLSVAKSAARRASYLAPLSVSVPDGPEEAVTGGPSAAVLLVQPRTPMIQRQASVKTPKKKPAPPPVEVAEAPTPRLTTVQPPARPERHAPRQTEEAASQATSSPPTAPTPVPTSAQTPQPAALPGGKAGPIGPAETGLFEKAATFPDYLANPAPAYPRSELRRGREGLVLLRVRVTPKGRPSEISVSRSSGIAAFDQAAVRAVRAWRFLPATRGGQPIAGTVKVPIRFALNRS